MKYVEFFKIFETPKLLKTASGSAINNLLLGDLRNVIFPLPHLSEQKRIVAEIENQLEKTKQLKAHVLANQAATEQLIKALLQEVFEVEGNEDFENFYKRVKVRLVVTSPGIEPGSKV